MKRIMGRSYFLMALLISSVFALCFSQGTERKEMRFEKVASFKQIEVKNEKGKVMIDFTMDYQDPGANTNPSAGYLFPPPPTHRNHP